MRKLTLLLCHYHANKCIKYEGHRQVVNYHRDKLTYYYRKAFGEEPAFRGDKN